MRAAVADIEVDADATDLPSDEARREAARVGMRLALWAKHQPDAPAIHAPAGDRTFSELNARANRLARALRARGLGEGDAVAIVCSNRPEFAEAVQACQRAGLRYTPVNWHLRSDELAYVVDDCEAKAVIGDVRFADVLDQAIAAAPRAVVRLGVGVAHGVFESYDDALAAESPTDLSDPIVGTRMLYTSGTTGRPKGVVRPPNYSTRLDAIVRAPRYRAGSGQLNLLTGPLYHGGPLGFSMTLPLAAGVGIVMMERWDAATALDLITRYRITHSHMVPTMFHRLLRLPDEVRARADVSSMQYILHGAAPCTVATKRAMMDWFGPILWEYFASTEGTAASVSPTVWLEKPGTVGKPLDDGHVRILDDEGRDLPANTPGDIYLRRLEGADFEYFRDPDKTARARRGDYFGIGDIGYLDDDGYLFITDRTANVIVSGGVNIYPAEVEAVLLAHPAVRDVAVVGVPNAEWGEEVRGVVECAEGVVADEALAEALIAHARESVAKFKCPRQIDFVDALPRRDNGKLYRRELRERYRRDTKPAT